MPTLIYGPGYRQYDFGDRHPFSPVRAEVTLDLIRELGVDAVPLVPEPATLDEVCEVHDPEYVEIVEALGEGRDVAGFERFGLGTVDNPIVPGMGEGARQLVGGTLTGARRILSDTDTRVLQLGGGLHHAKRASAAGFCIYSDLSIAIKEMVDAGMYVAYVDIDAHHCDGVQETFYSSEQVMTISLHESPEFLFPGTGWVHDLGRGMGRGHHLNVPLDPFTQGDSYLAAFDAVVGPALSWFRPDVLVVQAGADGHASDPLADLMLTSKDYEALFHRLVALAERHTKGRLLVTLGGGYSLDAVTRVWAILGLVLWDQPVPDTVPEGWRRRWAPMLGEGVPEAMHDASVEPGPRHEEIDSHNRQTADRLLDAVAPLWL
jgi:acetoin utilization protein AcuC